MVNTNDLRKFIFNTLKTLCDNVYFDLADEDKVFPHIVFSFQTIDNNDLSRSDIYMDIDVWGRQEEAVEFENLCDLVERTFSYNNAPQDTNLPTFYNINRVNVIDEDKTLKHRTIEVLIQNYTRE